MSDITTIDGLRLMTNEALSHYTFTKTGGPSDYLAFPTSVAQVQAYVALAQQKGWPLTIIGNASNLIVRDGGIRGLTLILTEMHHIEAAGTTVTADAGARIIDTAEAAYQAGLTGLEFAAGIPGSVGGATFMNAGAYGGEVKDVIDTVTLLNKVGEIEVRDNAQMQFSYRHSLVQEDGSIVLAVSFKLAQGEPTKIREQMDHLNALRAAKQPLELPSCGSVFKRPVGHFVGPMIQEAGIQGHIIGGAQISMKHAGFIVNIDHATATDYIDMIHFVQATIDAKFHLHLEPEVRIIGEPGKDER